MSLIGVLDNENKSLMSGLEAVASRYSDRDSVVGSSDDNSCDPEVCIEKDGTIKITNRSKTRSSKKGQPNEVDQPNEQ